MCDCYGEKCAHKGCSVIIDMHLGDFETERDEVNVYCSEHLPTDRAAGVLWKVTDEEAPCETIFVECLTENARGNWNDNCFNGECEFVEVFGKPTGVT